jgi:hypothetical protein
VWATLFGLLLWDALFMPVPDVFRTPFQVGCLGGWQPGGLVGCLVA